MLFLAQFAPMISHDRKGGNALSVVLTWRRSSNVIMSVLTVAESKDHFERNGKRFFYLADNIWPAFAKASFAAWE